MTPALRSPWFGVDVVHIIRVLQSAGFCLDLDASAQDDAEKTPEGMAVLFEQMLPLLSRRKQEEKVVSVPALLGDGRRVDLLRLYSTVREKGGYRKVTAAGSWNSIADEFGLGIAMGSAVKLIYAKYLRALDRRLKKIRVREGKGTAWRRRGEGSFPNGVGSIGGVSSSGILDRGVGGGECRSSKNDSSCTALEGCTLREPDAGCDGDDDDVVVLDAVNRRPRSPSTRRKREPECFAGVLEWLKTLAKSPNSHSVSMEAGLSRSAQLTAKEILPQVLLVRRAMFENVRNSSESEGPPSQKKQKVNPSIYDDYPDSNLTHGPIRCSQRILSLKKLASCLGGATLSDIESDKDSDGSESDRNDREGEGLSDHTLFYMGGVYGKPEKCVSVGPDHQAKLLDWSGRSSPRSTNTKKYLGTPIWPPELSEQISFVKPVPIGRGRQECCGCSVQGSWECVRFHVAEKRFLLKCELGPAFFTMGFHRMGEEVSLSWTREEEQKFRTIIQENPASLGKSFWGPVFLCFPFKSRETLVRYYFNVFLLKRRGYQNRISPTCINSDDDDKSDFSSMSNDEFGREADDTQNLNSVICMQNSQCIHVDELSDT